MPNKEREKPYNLQVLEALRNRMILEKKDYYLYSNLLKGYEGECFLDELTDKLKDCLVLKNLTYITDGVEFQLDSVIVKKDEIILYEVKNYEGEYVYGEEYFRKASSNLEILNPLLRLSRSKLLLKQILKELRCDMPVKVFLIFVNPNFTLYQTPPLSTIVMPTNIHSHMEQLKNTMVPLTKRHMVLANKLRSLDNPQKHTRDLPKYNYEDLKKGVVCVQCGSFIQSLKARYSTFCCPKCGHRELVNQTLSRHAIEYQLLFPDRKLTAPNLRNWCGDLPPEKRIREVLQTDFQSKSTRRWRHFIPKIN